MAMQNSSSDASTSTAANGAVQDFFSQAQQMWAPVTDAMQEQRALFERGLEDLEKARDANLRRTREAADEMVEVFKASMSYGIQLSHEWCSTSLAASRRTMSAWSQVASR